MLLFITIFPGILTLLLDRIGKLRKIKSIERYIIALALVSLLNLLTFHKNSEFILIILCSTLLFVFEYLILLKNKESFKKDIKYCYANMKDGYLIIILYPFFEEFVYRFAIYQISIKLGYSLWQYFVLSVFSFIFAHYYSQGFEAVKKVPFAIVQCVFYILFKDIYICIIIHIVFNIMVYLYRVSSYKNKRRYF